MTRIISGILGSLQLKSAAKATRPTSDRVKESMFSRLDSMGLVENASVLDLFAGTGALGFEAVSRGAKSLTLVEKDRQAAALLNQNSKQINLALAKAGITAEIQVQETEAKKFLAKSSARFDLVFIDPPYEFGNEQLQEIITLLTHNLTPAAILVIERSSKTAKTAFTNFQLVSEKNYGDTAVSFFEWTK